MKSRLYSIANVLLLLLIFLGIFCFNSQALARNNIDPDWYAFSLNPKLDPSSCANLGKLILDAPAGKYGFLNIKDADFCFSNNQKQRFWGINLNQAACFPDKKQAEVIAENLAFLGFNSVRLSGFDFDFAPNGIFEDIGANYRDEQLKATEYLNLEQLDRLDYLIYQLKQKGIYICLNLLSERNFTQADGIVDAELLEQAGGAAAIFDEDLIELQKEYTQTLLNHENKYTKLKYNQDPAIALIEITNTNSLFAAWKNNTLNGNLFGAKKDALTVYYTSQLDYAWNQYLRKKYKSTKNLQKTWREDNNQTKTEPLNKVTWKLEAVKKAKASLKNKENSQEIRIRRTSSKPSDLQYQTNYLNLFKNKKYLLSFVITANRNMRIGIIAEQVFSPWNNLGLNQELDISSVPQIITIPFSPKTDCDNAQVSFVIGQRKGTINITDLELKQIDSLPIIDNETKLTQFKFHRPVYKMIKLYPKQEKNDITEFYTKVSSEYFKNMSDFLKKQCAVKVPITGIAAYRQHEDIAAQNNCDYISTTAYWDYPKFTADYQDKTNFTIKNNSALEDKNLGILGEIQHLNPNARNKKTRPFIVSAWNHCFPNKFAYESPTLLGSVAGMNHWNGLFQFNYSSTARNDRAKNNKTMINDFFEIVNNPQQLLLSSVAGLAFHYELETPKIKGLCGFTRDKTLKAGTITGKPADNGAVFLCALDQKPAEQSKHFLLIALSEIKNLNSGWKKSKFNWGTPPTILKRMNLDISIPTNKKAIVYVLDNRGKRRHKIKLHISKDMLSFNTQNYDSPWFEIILNP